MATSYTVTADRLHVVDPDTGKRRTYYRGDSVSGLPKAAADRYKGLGAIASAGGDAAAEAKDNPTAPNPSEASTGEPTAPAPTGITVPQASEIVADTNGGAAPAVVRPPNAGTTEAWRDYAVQSGQLTREEADAKGRDALRDSLK